MVIAIVFMYGELHKKLYDKSIEFMELSCTA